MRSIVAAIALVLAMGVVQPTEADARAPRTVEKWGCTFVAEGVGTRSTVDPNRRWPVYGMAHWQCPGGGRRLSVTISVFRENPGGADLLLRRNRVSDWYSRIGYHQLSTDIFWCEP